MFFCKVHEENAYVEQLSGMSANIQPVCCLHVSIIKAVFQDWRKTWSENSYV